MMQYQYTQRAVWMHYIMAVLLPGNLIVGVIFDKPFVWLLIGLGSVALILLTFVFSSMTIDVTPERLRWYFGLGVWCKTLQQTEIVSAKVFRMAWWHAPGIRMTRHGWLYTMSGRDAVLIKDSRGKTRLIGTNKPHELVSALQPLGR